MIKKQAKPSLYDQKNKQNPSKMIKKQAKQSLYDQKTSKTVFI